MLARVVVLVSLALGTMAVAEKCSKECNTGKTASASDASHGVCTLNQPASCWAMECAQADIPKYMTCVDCQVKEGNMTQEEADFTLMILTHFCNSTSTNAGGAPVAPFAAGTVVLAGTAVLLAGAAMFL